MLNTSNLFETLVQPAKQAVERLNYLKIDIASITFFDDKVFIKIKDCAAIYHYFSVPDVVNITNNWVTMEVPLYGCMVQWRQPKAKYDDAKARNLARRRGNQNQQYVMR